MISRFTFQPLRVTLIGPANVISLRNTHYAIFPPQEDE